MLSVKVRLTLALASIIVAVAGDLAADREKYLLPSDIEPVHYNLSIYTNIDNFNDNDERTFVYNGTIVITINVVNETSQIVLHSFDDITIKGVAVVGDQGVVSASVGGYDYESNKQIIQVTSALKKGSQYNVTIDYSGRNTLDLTGFYRSSYTVLLSKRWLLVTDFEPFGARRAFPCFDEPRYKATFQLTSYIREVFAGNEGYKTRTNGDLDFVENRDGWNIARFKKTPLPISTYLVAFLISDFGISPEPSYFNSSYNGEDGVKPFSTLGQSKFFSSPRQDLISQVSGPAVINFMTKKTGVGYGYDKIHQAGIPDFGGGAMENWGLVTYRENLLFWNENSGTQGAKQQVVQVIAHELGHQWFGDLVTLHWWTDLWLNEGFATFFETFAAKEIREPTLDTSSWDLEGQFVQYVMLGSAFFDDGYDDTRALTSEAYDRDTIGNYFDSISYQKGGTILRMWMNILGEDLFYSGLKIYLNSQAEKTGTPEILLASFDEAVQNLPAGDRPKLPIPAAELFAPWHLESGYPVVNVKRNGALLTFTQERFVYWGDANTKYNIPLTYSTNLENNFNNTAPAGFLLASQDSSSLTIENSAASWIIINNQATGYYRVNYDQANWDALLKILDDPDSAQQIHPFNRAQIIDDANNLGVSLKKEYLPFSYALSFFRTLRHERDLMVWRTALTSMNKLLLTFASYPKTQMLLKAYFAWVIGPAFNDIGMKVHASDSHTQRLLRPDIADFACKIGLPACKKQVKEVYDSKNIHPDIRQVVMCETVRSGNDELWHETLDDALNSEAPIRSDMLASLTCTKNAELTKKLLDMTIDDARMSEVDATIIALAAASQNAVAAELTLNTLLKRRWNSHYDLDKIKSTISRNLATVEAADLAGKLSLSLSRRILANNEWLAAKQLSIQRWLEEQSYLRSQ